MAKVVTGLLTTPYVVQFYPKEEEKKIKSKRINGVCIACPQCFQIQNLCLNYPENIIKRRYAILDD